MNENQVSYESCGTDDGEHEAVQLVGELDQGRVRHDGVHGPVLVLDEIQSKIKITVLE